MEVKRLYKIKPGFIKMMVLTCLALGIALVTYFMVHASEIPFKEHLLKRDYEILYSLIDKPDFSKRIFNVYMDYNFGGDFKILEEIKKDEYIEYRLDTDNGEKTILLSKRDGRYVWEFDDYVYGWTIELPKRAKAAIENEPVENKDGQIVIDKLPFAPYKVSASMANCEYYSAKILAGQRVEIKLDLSSTVLEACRKNIKEYLEFKQNSLNSKIIGETSSVEKDSGVYREVISEVEWLKGVDYSVKKQLTDLRIDACTLDGEGLICVEVYEKWNNSIINQDNEDKKVEEYKNSYYLNPEDNYVIVKTKTNQI